MNQMYKVITTAAIAVTLLSVSGCGQSPSSVSPNPTKETQKT
ncbi:hypothetical protein ACKW0K_000018 [Listeria monocytogenes]